MSEMMTFPDTWEDFEKSYGFTDNEEVYTNGARLIPSYRVKQWLDHLPSVQPRKGRWLEASEDWRNQITWWQCSECGTPSSIKSNFCPNCGCRMEEGDAK